MNALYLHYVIFCVSIEFFSFFSLVFHRPLLLIQAIFFLFFFLLLFFHLSIAF